MRLLDTTTLELRDFIGDDIPSYAILSHRWEDEEVTFPDLQSGRGPEMKGYAKIQGCCRRAKEDGLEYAWIDSCCINKQDSSELSESINSMFQWYENSEVCYAYLSDVFEGDSARLLDLNRRLEESRLSIRTLADESFYKSKWFSRGWTLQELLAPDTVVFFDQQWVEIGTKSSLDYLLSKITGIATFASYKSKCIAQKMSWAAGRKTTKVEDRAYSLMGIMGVNMPLLYGEGEQAFIRLQMEILKFSDDESIFAWFGNAEWDEKRGLLATSPDQFQESGDISIKEIRQRPEYLFTNKGLKIEMDLYEVRQSTRDVVTPGTSRALSNLWVEYLTPLNCEIGQSPAHHIALRLVRPLSFQQEDRQQYASFYRMSCVELASPLQEISMEIKPTTKNIYAPQSLLNRPMSLPSEISVKFHELYSAGFRFQFSSSSSKFRDGSDFRLPLKTLSSEKGEIIFKFPKEYLYRHMLVLFRFNRTASDDLLDVVIKFPELSKENGHRLPGLSMLIDGKGQKPRVPSTFDITVDSPLPEVPYFHSGPYALFWHSKKLLEDRIRLSLSKKEYVVAALKRSRKNGSVIYIIELTVKEEEVPGRLHGKSINH